MEILPGSITFPVSAYSGVSWEMVPYMGIVANAFSIEPPCSAAKPCTRSKKKREHKIDELLLRPQLTEAEAAYLMGIPQKSLANTRRAGGLPRGIYVQNGEGHKVYYITVKLIAHINSQGEASRTGRNRK